MKGSSKIAGAKRTLVRGKFLHPRTLPKLHSWTHDILSFCDILPWSHLSSHCQGWPCCVYAGIADSSLVASRCSAFFLLFSSRWSASTIWCACCCRLLKALATLVPCLTVPFSFSSLASVSWSSSSDEPIRVGASPTPAAALDELSCCLA